MKLEIKRTTREGKALLGGLKFEYSLSVKLLANDEEKKLWEKYRYRSEDFSVIRDSDPKKCEVFAKDIKGWYRTSFDGLLKGYTWSAKELYLLFTEIPAVIAQRLRDMQGELNSRERWNGQNESLDLGEE